MNSTLFSAKFKRTVKDILVKVYTMRGNDWGLVNMVFIETITAEIMPAYSVPIS